MAPGFITTDMTGELTEDIKQKILGVIPLGRFGSPEDVANAVVWLCSDEASMLVGETVHLDGGFALSAWRALLEG